MKSCKSSGTSLEQVKQAITIHEAWERLKLPGEPGKACHAPYREDKNKSFSVSGDGLLFNDFARGKGGDVLDFIELVLDVDNREAIRIVREWYQGKTTCKRVMPAREKSKPRPAKPKQPIPELDNGNPSELKAVSVQRGFSEWSALDWMYLKGIFGFCTFRGRRAWVVRSSTADAGQARRADGLPWWDDGPKSLSVGTEPERALGFVPENPKAVFITEGETDLMALASLLYRIFPPGKKISGNTLTDYGMIALAGVSKDIDLHTLQAMARSRVRVFLDKDEAGFRAGLSWRDQLQEQGCHVDFWHADEPGRDLGDVVSDLRGAQGEVEPLLDEITKSLPGATERL